MAPSNLERFYYDKFDRAVQLFDNDENEAAADVCCELLEEFLCPRLLQVQALQLRSLCRDDYWMAKDCLTKALQLLKDLGDDGDELVREYRVHTEKMLQGNESLWLARWENLGEKPPSKQSPSDYVEDDAAEEEEPAGDTESSIESDREEELTKLASMALDDIVEGMEDSPEEIARRGHSSPSRSRPGGTARPWERGVDEGGQTGMLSPLPEAEDMAWDEGEDKMETD